MPVHSSPSRRLTDLHRVEVVLDLSRPDLVDLTITGYVPTSRPAAWVDHTTFDHEAHILTPIDEVYAALHDVLVARPRNGVEYRECRQTGGSLTTPLFDG